MIAARLSQLATVVDTRLVKGDAPFAGVSTDTRTLRPGELFVALRGERFDGHLFVADAKEKGAAGVVTEQELDDDLPQLVCADTQEALGQIARWWRTHGHARVIGITGSNGKTTVKTLVASILSRVGRTHVNAGNLNNEIGLPLSLLKMPVDADFAVLEMGAGKPGDIAYLAGIAVPDVALVNNVAPAHLERMKSLEGVAETKGAIYSALPPSGVAVINADDAFAARFAELAGGHRIIRFSVDQDVEIDASNVAVGEQCRFTLRTPAEQIDIVLPLAGLHNVRNALAAAAIAFGAGAPSAAIKAGLEGAPGVAGRLTRHALPNGVTLIDDSYNANPGSVKAAIDTLAHEPGTRWLVLGNMAELGPGAEALHADVGTHAKARGIDRLYTVGSFSAAASAAFGANARHFRTHEEAVDALRRELRGGVTVLVKGSRSSAMERVVQALLAQLGAPSNGGGTHAA